MGRAAAAREAAAGGAGAGRAAARATSCLCSASASFIGDGGRLTGPLHAPRQVELPPVGLRLEA